MDQTKELRGRKFIADKIEVRAGVFYDRTCGMCDNADYDGERIPCIAGNSVQAYFKIQGQEVPPILDGQQIGHFCPEYRAWSPYAE